uniref:Uncharacterized protein n=1 Tax=Faxonius propinquus nudivirus TaxID=3139431 RepID=A0AAU8GBR6_9VIRU
MATNIGILRNPPIPIITINCFHKIEILDNIIIARCEFKKTKNGLYYHVIYFKDEINPVYLKYIKSIICKYTRNDLVNEIWEEITNIPISSLYNIGSDCNLELLNELITQMICLLAQMISKNYVYTLLVKNNKNVFKIFLSNMAAVIQHEESFRFIHMNRYNIKYIENLPDKNKISLLKKQFFSILELVKTIFFIKLSSKDNKKNLYPSCIKCKLVGYGDRFLNNNSPALHDIYCQQSINKIQQICNLTHIFPEAYNDITLAIKHIEKINNTIQQKKDKK